MSLSEIEQLSQQLLQMADGAGTSDEIRNLRAVGNRLLARLAEELANDDGTIPAEAMRAAAAGIEEAAGFFNLAAAALMERQELQEELTEGEG